MAFNNANPAAGDRGARQDAFGEDPNVTATTNSPSIATKQLPLGPTRAGRADPQAVFKLRCRSRSRLFAAGEIDLHTAEDELQFAAVANGLVAKLGQDEVHRLMAEAFAAVRPGGKRIRADRRKLDPLLEGLKLCADTKRHLEEWERRKAAAMSRAVQP
jgi:hypothetical protein